MKIEIKPYYEYRFMSEFEKIFYHYESDKPISRTLIHYEIYQNGKKVFTGRKFYTFDGIYGENFKFFINENEIDYDVCKNVKIYDVEKENTYEVLEEGQRIFKYQTLKDILDTKNMIFRLKERKWLFSSDEDYNKILSDIEDTQIQLIGLRRNKTVIDKNLDELKKENEDLKEVLRNLQNNSRR